MKPSHNKLNNLIGQLENIATKGQTGAKQNKYRNIRATIRQMRNEQARPITIKDVLCYLAEWLQPRNTEISAY